MRLKKTIFLVLITSAGLLSQTTPQQIARVLEPALQTPDVVAFQLRQYLNRKAPPAPVAGSATHWKQEAERIRKRVLENVIYHGWPREWVEAPLKAEDLGPIPSGAGYRMRKLRYEIVPGFQSTAVLYLPEKLDGKAPAILNVNGHATEAGKSVEYKQKRCINFARHGIIALNLEWLGCGELNLPENAHWFAGHLDLAGANGVGLFYLAMRRGLDYLAAYPGVDQSRLGVTGLSGGGWQTILLSALDERVAVSVPVAGYASLRSRLERPGDVGDLEQNATDLLVGQDYTHLTAIRAPRPTLLIYNAEDDCCFRAPFVKPYVFDPIKPFFALYGRSEDLAWHENTDPATHNYQLDNRLQAYRFFSKHFHMPEITGETGVDAEVKTFDELAVGLPEGNLTVLGLARKLAAQNQRQPASRERLAEVVRYREVKAGLPWAITNTKNKGLESHSGRFDFDNGLSASGVWLKSISAPSPDQVTILLNDKGKKASAGQASERVNRGEGVLAADLLFTGDSVPGSNSPLFAEMLAAVGDRPLGIEAAQLAALARLVQKMSGARTMRIEATGPRSQAVSLVAAALNPGVFREIAVRDGMASLQRLFDAPVAYQDAPDLFCLDLYKHFDLDRLAELAGPTVVRTAK